MENDLNEIIEEAVSKMYFYFFLVADIAKESNPQRKDEIEIITSKFKRVALKIHHESNFNPNILHTSFSMNINQYNKIKDASGAFHSKVHSPKKNPFQNTYLNFDNLNNTFSEHSFAMSTANERKINKPQIKAKKIIPTTSKPLSIVRLNNDSIVTTHEKGDVSIWNAAKKSLIITFKHSESSDYNIYSLAKIDEMNFVTGEWSKDGSVVVWNWDNEKCKSTKRRQFNEGVSYLCKVMSGVVGIGFINGIILSWNIFADKVFNKIELHKKEIRSILITPKFYISGSRDRKIMLWDISTKAKSNFQFKQEHKGWVNCLHHVNYQQTFASGGGDTVDPVIKIWKFNTETSIKTILMHNDVITYLSFNKDSGYLYSSSLDHHLKKFNSKFELQDEYILPISPDRVENVSGNDISEDEIWVINWKYKNIYVCPSI